MNGEKKMIKLEDQHITESRRPPQRTPAPDEIRSRTPPQRTPPVQENPPVEKNPPREQTPPPKENE